MDRQINFPTFSIFSVKKHKMNTNKKPEKLTQKLKETRRSEKFETLQYCGLETHKRIFWWFRELWRVLSTSYRSSRAEKNSSLIEKKENESSRIASSSYGKVKKGCFHSLSTEQQKNSIPKILLRNIWRYPDLSQIRLKAQFHFSLCWKIDSCLMMMWAQTHLLHHRPTCEPRFLKMPADTCDEMLYLHILRFFFKFRINLAFDIDFVTLTSSWIARFNVDIRQCMWKNSKLSNENSIDIEKSLILKLYHVWEASKFLLYWIFTSLSSFHLMSMPNLTQWHLVLTPTLAAMSSSSLKLYRDTEEFSWFLFNLKIEIKNSNKYSSLSLHGLSWVSFTSLFALSPRFQHILCVKRVENLCHFKKEFFIYSIEKYYCCATACTKINLVFSCSLLWGIEAVNYTPQGLKPFIDEFGIFLIFWVFLIICISITWKM